MKKTQAYWIEKVKLSIGTRSNSKLNCATLFFKYETTTTLEKGQIETQHVQQNINWIRRTAPPNKIPNSWGTWSDK